jgi:hypothetical protein
VLAYAAERIPILLKNGDPETLLSITCRLLPLFGDLDLE